MVSHCWGLWRQSCALCFFISRAALRWLRHRPSARLPGKAANAVKMLMSVIASEADIERRAFARPLRANWMTNEQVIVDDVLTSKIFVDQPAQKVLLEAEVRAVISTLLRSSKGNLLGVISTHFSRPGHPSERQLRLTNILAQPTSH
jgi:GAF domain-containing protein